MKWNFKGIVAVLAGVAVIASSAVVSYAAHLPVPPASDGNSVYTVPSPPEEKPILFALRNWRPAGMPGYYAYELHVQARSSDVVKLEYRFGTTGEFQEIPNKSQHFVNVTNAGLYIEVQAHMKNGYVYKDSFSYGLPDTPSSSSSSTSSDSREAPVSVTLRNWRPAGGENQYAYELIIQASSTDVESIGYKFGEGEGGHFTSLPDNHTSLVGIVEGSLGPVTVRAVMDDGAVLYKTFHFTV